jgi:hypothetical protein
VYRTVNITDMNKSAPQDYQRTLPEENSSKKIFSSGFAGVQFQLGK